MNSLFKTKPARGKRMLYHALNEKTLVDYLLGRPAVADRLARGADLTVKEVGDGNLNLVFIVSSSAEPARAVIVKQALDYLRVAGESWPLTRERMRFETQAMLLYNRLCPGLVPEIYDHDPEMSLLVMEYLGAHEIMRKALVQRRRFPKFVDHMSTFLANSLFSTSDFCLPGVEKKEMQARFINPHLNKLQEDFVYTNPYISSPENKWNPLIDAEVSALRGNAEVKAHIAQMKADYMTHAEALIHADLHTGSIMLNESDTRVIDPEFSYFGPMAYDVGAVLQNLVLNCLSHFGHTPDRGQREEYQEYVLGLVRGVWNEFARKLDALWQEKPERGPHAAALLGVGGRSGGVCGVPTRHFCTPPAGDGGARRDQVPEADDGHRQRVGYREHRRPCACGRSRRRLLSVSGYAGLWTAPG